LSNQLPLVMSTSSSPSQAVFIISNFAADVSHIQNVTFAFGSAGTNNLVGTPEPSTFALAAVGLAALAAWRLRRR
jgi:MYXO-CTERM domain-containing protein